MNRSRLPAAIIGLAFILTACSKTPFEKAHDQALRHNPAGITFKIRTKNDQKVFRQSERIPLFMTYESKYPGVWHIEVADGDSGASAADVAFISSGTQSGEQFLDNGFVVCCATRHVWLNQTALRIPYMRSSPGFTGLYRAEPYKHLRLSYPGEYAIYVQSHRIFSSSESLLSYSNWGHLVTSENIVYLKVIPNDPEWDEEELRKVITVLNDKNSQQTEVQAACSRLSNDLNSESAVVEALNRINKNSSCGYLGTAKRAQNPKAALDLIRTIALNPEMDIPRSALEDMTTLTLRVKIGDKALPEHPNAILQGATMAGISSSDASAARREVLDFLLTACKTKKHVGEECSFLKMYQQ